jgi:large subunit ribosomal protein L9
MLIPKGIATEATEGNVRNLEKQKAIKEEQHQKELSKAKQLAEKMGQIKVSLMTKSGEGGRLFGSITSKDIAEALEKQHNISIDKKKIVLENPIKQTGDFEIDVKIYPEVSAKLHVTVTA